MASSVVSSQLAAHRPYGGVVPEIASREHLVNWPVVAASAFAEAGVSAADLDVVAATAGPGLVGALLVGLSIGKAMAFALERPFYAVHHLEGHLYSPFLPPPGVAAGRDIELPDRFVGLVLSGGHSSLFAVDEQRVETLGETRDDAMGEVFDKLGKRLGLPYPQGPQVDEFAERGDPDRLRLPIPACSGTLDFSFSGLKSQALLELERLEQREGRLTPISADAADLPPSLSDLIAAFRKAAVGQVIDRLDKLLARQPFARLAVSGGVAANRLLRRELPEWAARRGVELRLVPLAYAGDNAAMIAFAALLRQRRGVTPSPWTAEAESRVPL